MAKNITIRVDDEFADQATDRAEELGISRSDYIRQLISADLEHDIMGALNEETVDPEEAKEMLEKLQKAGYVVSPNTGTSHIIPEASIQPNPSVADPMRAMKDRIRRPVMKDIPDLVAESMKPGIAQTQGRIYGGPDANLKMQIRAAHLKSVQEEREENQMKKTILEEVGVDDQAEG